METRELNPHSIYNQRKIPLPTNYDAQNLSSNSLMKDRVDKSIGIVTLITGPHRKLIALMILLEEEVLDDR